MTLTETTAAGTAPARDLQNLSAQAIAARIAAGALSSADAVEHFVARLKAVNGKLNAVTADLSESARQIAANVDRARARGEKLGPLGGVPVTIKECFDLAGTASTFGLTTRRDEIESTDDPYVAALRAAGAIPIAKTNLPQLMIFTEADNPLYGRTNNPWDLERSCGGSSGGEAAVIAAGASPFGIGNDIGHLRFASLTDDGEFPVAPAVRRAVGEAAQYLIAAGAKHVAWQPPSLSRAVDLLFACLSPDTASFRRLLRGNRIDRRVRSLLRAAGMPPWLRRIAASASGAFGQQRTARNLRRFASGSVDDYWLTIEDIAAFRHDLLCSFEQATSGPIDVVLLPAYAVPAVRHGATELMPMPGAYIPLANVSGFPAGVLPVTRVRSGEESNRPASRDVMDRIAREAESGSAGLPIAVQVLARPWRDHVALAAMAAIEAAARGQADYPVRPPL